MYSRPFFIATVILAVSSASFGVGITVSVGQANGAEYAGSGGATNTSVGNCSPKPGIQIGGIQIASSGGLCGYGQAAQNINTTVSQQSNNTTNRQWLMGSARQHAEQVSGPGMTTGSQVGQVHMLQTNDQLCGGITKQSDHAVATQAGQLIASTCGAADFSAVTVVKQATQVQNPL